MISKQDRKMNLTRYNGIHSFYFNRIIKTIIRLGKLKSCGGMILDFGGGVSRLKEYLPNNLVCSYDKDDMFSDIHVYTNYRPNIIIVNHVFEHMTPQEIHDVLNDFYDMNRDLILITGIPIENKLSKFFSVMLGRPSHHGHITSIHKINNILRQHCVPIKTKKVFRMTEISVWLMAD